ncbi:MAG: TIR domain-containing protein [Chlorobiaceae bacterium]|nr:TIR domain-containing protein [Chlorobiaceae bacterium]
MPEPQLQDVFKTSGVPSYTFVQPQEYVRLLLNLRTSGRGLVIEGPSGIGKTTAVENALIELGLSDTVTKLSARLPEDIEYIAELPIMGKVGTVIVDDFHKLPDTARQALADYMKTLADRSSTEVKIIVVGINKAGENLVHFAHDLVNRLDIVPFESNPDERVEELLTKGQEALNISLNIVPEIVQAAKGSFFLAQMLAFEVCLASNITNCQDERRIAETSFEAVKAEVWKRLSVSFRKRCERFCRGSKMKPAGRAPYLHILKWLAEEGDWTLDLREAMRRHREMTGSVGQVVTKGFLAENIDSDVDIGAVLHFDEASKQLTVEDPLFVFYIRNMPWALFARECGFVSVDFQHRYDFALSFAGQQRRVAEALNAALLEHQVEVFYDRNEQHRILAQNVEEYLLPIYQSEARYVIPLLSSEYPERIWARIETDAFKARFGDNAVIPIWFSNASPSAFDESRRYGGVTWNVDDNLIAQADQIASVLVQKLAEDR